VAAELKKGLGRRVPPDWKHVDKFPLTASTIPAPPTPIVGGFNWYEDFDHPIKIGSRYWIGKNSDGSIKQNLGGIRGGHAICIKPENVSDVKAWRPFYNQGSTGECEGFSHSRMMSLLNRHRYDAAWLYFQATEVDEYPGNEGDPNYGTSNRATLNILKTKGHKIVYGSTNKVYDPDLSQGISAYRWATTFDDCLLVLSDEGTASFFQKIGGVPLLNSWGVFPSNPWGFASQIWIPFEVMQRLLNEDGEAGLVTDR